MTDEKMSESLMRCIIEGEFHNSYQWRFNCLELASRTVSAAAVIETAAQYHAFLAAKSSEPKPAAKSIKRKAR
jgi:hypothetical protein